jgi:oxygen-dependent protoporphyrinogen oxidase
VTGPESTNATVVVVGGGISGLVSAYKVRQARPDATVVLIDRSEKLGGKISTSTFMGRQVDEGPDAFLTRVPWAIDLCDELGILDEVISPSSGSAYVMSRGKLRRLPEGLVLGVPTRFWPLLKSGIVNPFGALRTLFDLVRPTSWPDTPETVGGLSRRRLGNQVAERLVDPLIGAINAGDTDELDLHLVAPQLENAARQSRSLISGLKQQRKNLDPEVAAAPVFHSFPSGMSRLVSVLTDRLRDVEIRLAATVEHVHPTQRGADVILGSGEIIRADSVILATPAYVTAALLGKAAPEASADLSGIEYASVAMVTLGFERAAIGHPLDGSGMLVPRPEGHLSTAVSWASTKWPHWADDGKAILRVSAGRMGDDRFTELNDDELVDTLSAEMANFLDINGPVLEWRVTRWPRSFPQYGPGHADLITRIEERLAHDAPGVFITGASCRGLGIPACVRQGGEAAELALSRLTSAAK